MESEYSNMDSPGQLQTEEKIETAEEAVRIVRRFTSIKNNQQRKQQIVDLCTDIATLLDTKKRLETLVKAQNEELVLLRGQLQTSHNSTNKQDTSPLSATTPQLITSSVLTAEDLTQRVFRTPSEGSLVVTPSSGRGTLCDRGTDPLYPWPEDCTTELPDRSNTSSPTSFELSSTPSSERSKPPSRTESSRSLTPPITSTSSSGEVVELLTRLDKSNNLATDLTSTTPTGETTELTNRSESTSHSYLPQSSSTIPTGNAVKQLPLETVSDEENRYESDFESDSLTTNEEEKDIKFRDYHVNEHNFSDKEHTDRSRFQIKSSARNSKTTSLKKATEARKKVNKSNTRKTLNQNEKKLQPGPVKVEIKRVLVNPPEKKKKGKNYSGGKRSETMRKGNETQSSHMRENSKVDTKVSSYYSKKTSGSSINSRGRSSSRKRSGESCKESQWSATSSSSEESEEEIRRKVPVGYSTEYWEIHKLVKFLRIGNPTATVIVLCALQELNLANELNQQTFMDLGGVLLLVNLLRTNEQRCKIGSLQVLKEITHNKRINIEIYRLGGLHQLVECLDSECKVTQSLAAVVLAQVITFKKAYSGVRKTGGIQKLVKLLTPSKSKLSSKSWKKSEQDPNLWRNTCMALWSCSRSAKNIQTIRDAGAVPLLRMLLDSAKDDVVLPTVGIIQECANELAFREDIRKEQIIERIVKQLKIGNAELKTLCAKTIEKCAEDDNTRELVRRKGGLEELVALLSPNSSVDTELLAAVVGAVWKCSINQNNMIKLEEMGALTDIIRWLKGNQPHAVASKLLGALCEFCYHRRNLLTIMEQKVLQYLVTLLNLTEPGVLVGTCNVIAVCSRDTRCRRIILDSDGLRLLWSALKFPDPKICTSSMDAITECTVIPEESAQIVRSFVGGLEMVTKLLRSDLKEVQLCTTKAIINIGKDRENLSIMTDYDVVPLLISLTYTNDEELQTCVAEAIATCCGLEKNVTAFSSAVVPLAEGVKAFKGVGTQRAMARAMERLSQDTRNCCIMHQYGILKDLIAMTGSTDEALQEAAAKCIKNIRINILEVLQR